MNKMLASLVAAALVGMFGRVTRVELVDLVRRVLDQRGVGRHAFFRRIQEIGQQGEVQVRVAVGQEAHFQPFDQRVDAMMRLLAHPEQGHYTVDAMRRAIESLPRDEYDGLGYYERWVRAIRQLVVEKGLLSEDELNRKLAVLAREP